MATTHFCAFILSVVLFGTAAQELHEQTPCEMADCGIDFLCFHKFQPAEGTSEAVCIPIHGVNKELDYVATDHAHFKKACPRQHEIGIGKDLAMCPEDWKDECMNALDCQTSELCCFNGCKKKCRKFQLQAHLE